MIQPKSETLVRALLLIGSILMALALVEVGLRIFPPSQVTTSSGFFPRYLINGRPAPSIDYFTRDPQLPVTLIPGYQNTLADLAWHPVPFKVTLDKYGYRNRGDQGDKYSLVVVGDSVAFGYGVNDDNTIAARLGGLTSTYSLAIPNAGPEMYMAMLERFLGRAMASQVAVLFYEGNDYQNLANASWQELETCSPPRKSRIFRTDIPLPPEQQSDIPSGSLAVPLMVKRVIRQYFDSQPSDLCELPGIYDKVSAAAIEDLGNLENYERRLKDNMPIAMSYLQQLAAAPCVEEATRNDIEGVIWSIRANETERLASRMRKISADLAERNCYPIGKGFPDANSGRSLAIYANYYAGYYYDYISSARNGYDGNVRNFQALLDQMRRRKELSSEHDRIDRLRNLLSDKRGTASVAEASASLKAALSKLANTCVASVGAMAGGCDKENLFLEYLDSLRSRKIDVTLFSLPSENALSYPRLDNSRICQKALVKGIKCKDLQPLLATQYLTTGGNGYYLDGAHLTVEGSAKVAQWVAAELGLNPVERFSKYANEYSLATKDPISSAEFSLRYGKWFRSVPKGGLYDLYEVKTEKKGQKADIHDGRFSSSAESVLSVLVRRNIFSSENWKIKAEFTINDVDVVTPQTDNGEPIFFTFSDDKHAGFVTIWPRKVEYFDLGPSVRKVDEWVIPYIANKRVKMILHKSGAQLEIDVAGVSHSVTMDGAVIAPHNYEVPVFSREGDLPGPKTRNFMRFGTVFYPFLTTNPILKIHSLEVME